MDFGDFENGCSNFFSIMHIHENRFFQDITQHRSRRSPCKKLKSTRTSASLVIDQLKNDFRRFPSDFTPRMRTRRNWHPESLIKYLHDNRCDFNEERIVKREKMQHRERSFVPQMPKICSIGLHFNARSLSNSNDLSSLYDATKNFKRRFDIVLRPMFTRKYWIEKSTPTSSSTLLTSTDVSLETEKNCQIAIIDCAESINISKHDRIQENNYNQSYETHVCKEKSNDISDPLRSDYAAGDRSFISNDSFKDSFVRKEYRSCVTRDAQIQTLARKNSRRKKTKKRSKMTDERISHRNKHDESRKRILMDFRVNSNKRDRYEKSRLYVQFLENKRADYINKFTAVNRQIEEITATLRETCYNDNSRINSRNWKEEYFSSGSDENTMINTNKKSDDVENKSTIAREGNRKTKRKDNDLKDVKRIVKKLKSDRRKNMLEVLHDDNNLNDEFLDLSNKECSKNTIASSINPAVKQNDIFVRDSTRTFSIDKTVYPSNRNSGNEKKGKRRFVKQISFDLDVMRNDNKQKDLIEDFVGLEESRYYNINIGEKVGETVVLENIKKRIDKDFDDRSFYEITPMEDVTFVEEIEEEEPKSTSLIVSGSSSNLDLTEIQVRDSISADADVSEYSDKNSTLSEYFSCMRFPSMVSFAENENENELALGFENHSITAHDSLASNSFSNYHYYCSRSNLNGDNFTRSNLDTSFDRCSYSNTKESVADYISSNKFPIEIATIDATFELSEDQKNFVEDKIFERFFEEENERKERESRIEFEKQLYTTDYTFETSNVSSRYIGSIDSGVFSSSLIDLYPRESFRIDDSKEFKKKRRVEKLDGSSRLIVDFNSDSSCTDDNLDQRVNDVVRDLTEKLILCERRMKLKKMQRKMGRKTKNNDRYYPSRQTPSSRTCKFSRSLSDDAYCDLFNSRFNENERIVNISTPTLLSLSDSEIENRNELIC